MPFRRPNSPHFYVEIRTPGGVARRSTGTTLKSKARAIETALHDLATRRRWELLNAVIENCLTPGEVYDAVIAGQLDALQERLADSDIEPEVDRWLGRHAERVSRDTIVHYRHLVRSFIPMGRPMPQSSFTVDALDEWLAAYPASRSTRRKAHIAMSCFASHLVRVARLIPANPMRSIDIPKQNPPRTRHIDVSEMQRLAEAQVEPFRTLSALLGGSGIEVSVAVRLLRRDVDTKRREIHAAGTKTHARDRIVRVAEWAWPYVEARCAGLLPNAPLFPGVDRWSTSDAHRAACVAIGIEDYQLRDQRHSYAVRAARAGTPSELISRQLGHADAVLVLKVYGRFMPSAQERDKWEKIAALQDGDTQVANA